MKTSTMIQRLAVAVLALPFLGLIAAGEGVKPPGSMGTITQAISVSSVANDTHSIKLMFLNPGLMKAVLVKPGDPVKAGQELAREDTDLDDLELARLKLDADSTARLEAANKDCESKKIEADNKKKAFDSGIAASFSEWDEARLAYEEAQVNIVYAKEQQEIAKAEYAKQAEKIQKMKLISPVDGIVEKVGIQPGELVDPNKPDGAITLICNSPLWVEMHVPSATAAQLKLGDVLPVAYVNDHPDANDSGKWKLRATIIFFDPEVDAASDTQTLRLRLDNKEGLPPGLQMLVQLSPERGTASAGPEH